MKVLGLKPKKFQTFFSFQLFVSIPKPLKYPHRIFLRVPNYQIFHLIAFFLLLHLSHILPIFLRDLQESFFNTKDTFNLDRFISFPFHVMSGKCNKKIALERNKNYQKLFFLFSLASGKFLFIAQISIYCKKSVLRMSSWKPFEILIEIYSFRKKKDLFSSIV